jgi:hypothetical protein
MAGQVKPKLQPMAESEAAKNSATMRVSLRAKRELISVKE